MDTSYKQKAQEILSNGGMTTMPSVFDTLPTIVNMHEFDVYIYHIRFKTHRYMFHPDNQSLESADSYKGHLGDRPDNFGGWTVLAAKHRKTGKVHVGVARCSRCEPYDKKEGRNRASKRLRKAISTGVPMCGPDIKYKKEQRAQEFVQVLQLLPSWVVGAAFL